MGKRFPIAIIIIVLIAFTSNSIAAQTVHFVSDSWLPWVEGKEGGQSTGGYATAIMVELFKRINMPLKIDIYPDQSAHFCQATLERFPI
jgi:hypothetical protein